MANNAIAVRLQPRLTQRATATVRLADIHHGAASAPPYMWPRHDRRTNQTSPQSPNMDERHRGRQRGARPYGRQGLGITGSRCLVPRRPGRASDSGQNRSGSLGARPGRWAPVVEAGPACQVARERSNPCTDKGAGHHVGRVMHAGVNA